MSLPRSAFSLMNNHVDSVQQDIEVWGDRRLLERRLAAWTERPLCASSTRTTSLDQSTNRRDFPTQALRRLAREQAGTTSERAAAPGAPPAPEEASPAEQEEELDDQLLLLKLRKSNALFDALFEEEDDDEDYGQRPRPLIVSPDAWTVAANQIWPSALALVDHIVLRTPNRRESSSSSSAAQLQDDVRPRRGRTRPDVILELGCGLGSTGLLCSKLGLAAAGTVLTDMEAVVAKLRENLESGGFRPGAVSAEVFDWTDADDVEKLRQQTRELLERCAAIGRGGGANHAKPEGDDAPRGAENRKQTSLDILVVCADCVFAPLYGPETGPRLVKVLEAMVDWDGTMVAAPTDGGATGASDAKVRVSALVSVEHRVPTDGVEEFRRLLGEVCAVEEEQLGVGLIPGCSTPHAAVEIMAVRKKGGND